MQHIRSAIVALGGSSKPDIQSKSRCARSGLFLALTNAGHTAAPGLTCKGSILSVIYPQMSTFLVTRYVSPQHKQRDRQWQWQAWLSGSQTSFFANFSTIDDRGEHATPNILLQGELHALVSSYGSGLGMVDVILLRRRAFDASFRWLLFGVAPYLASASCPGRRGLLTPIFLVGGGESPSLKKARGICLVLMRVILVS